MNEGDYGRIVRNAMVEALWQVIFLVLLVLIFLHNCLLILQIFLVL